MTPDCRWPQPIANQLHVASAAIGRRHGCRLVHLSSDLVFSGKGVGNYHETDPTDPVTIYGKTMVNESYDKVGSPVTIGMKDSVLIAGAANIAKVPMPSHDVYIQRLLGAIAHGDGDMDQAVLGREAARASGLEK